MIDSNRLEELVHALEARGISTCDIELADGEVLRLRFARLEQSAGPDPLPDDTALENQVVPSQSMTIKSGGMGHFFRQHPLGDQTSPFSTVQVIKGELIGYLLIGEVVQPVVSSVAGRLTDQLVPDGQLVGYGDELYSYEPLA